MTDAVANAIRTGRVVAIVRESSEAAAQAEAVQLIAAGVRVIEVSLATPNALEVVRRIGTTQRVHGLHVGVGTVLDGRGVELAAAAGAEFIVSPIGTTDLVQRSRDLGLVSIVGAMTPTECFEAVTAGADFVKLFPANVWNAAAARDLLQALPALALVPTGGVDLESATSWLDAGCVAVGLGSALRRASAEGTLSDSLARLATAGHQHVRV